MQLPEPTWDYVQNRQSEFDNNPNYFGAEQAVGLVFTQWPTNTAYDEILVKVTVLNRMYSTNIYDIWTVAEHIRQLDIDDRLKAGDITLVEAVASVQFHEKTKYLYSFATKYCAWHQPDHYQIYDSYVDWLLWQYHKQYSFSSFRRYELRTYSRYVEVINDFCRFFKLYDGNNQFCRKSIDKFLWIEGVQQWKRLQDDKDV